MFGFLLQWLTVLTLLMFPLLIAIYVRLARHEEAEARRTFGATYDAYVAITPGWLPRLGSPARRPAGRLQITAPADAIAMSGRPHCRLNRTRLCWRG